MNAVMNESRENLAEFRAPGPGERLKAARLSLGLEPAKVAAQLHLSTDMVHAIERDDYSAMPARVFVRGYIKNYARVVGLPADSLLKQLEEQFPDEAAKNGLNRVGTDIRRELRSSNGVVRFFTWVIVLGLGVLFVLWWRGHLDLRLQVDNGATEPTENAAATMALPGGDGMLALPGVYPGASSGPMDGKSVAGAGVGQTGGSASSDSGPSASGPSGSDAAEDRVLDRVAAVPGSVSGNESAPATVAEPVDRAVAEAETAAVAASNVGQPLAAAATGEAPAAGGAESAPAASAGTVVIEFREPCWVDIRDSARQFKLYGEMAAGRREILGGVPPYKLIIGNARAASLSIDGKPFDLRAHTSGNVARFTLTTN